MKKPFGTINKINLREIWSNEASDFTPWLSKNIRELGETLGIELELIETEASVGDFSLDVLAKDLGSGENVVIENQFGVTNHDHLGKLLTYASGFDASTIIWIAETIREEHRQAMDYLNQRTDTDTRFFGIVVDVITIDDSKPAYSFRPIVYPNEWKKTRKSGGRKGTSPRAEAYRKYFQILIDELREKHKFTGARIAQPQSWYTFSSGASGMVYAASFSTGGRVRTELYIDKGDAEENKKIFDALYEEKEALETDLGSSLEWERLDDKRASRIALYIKGSIDDNEKKQAEIVEWHIENLLSFKRVFGSRMQDY